MIRSRSRLAGATAALVLLLACASDAPLVQSRAVAPMATALDRVAVAPFLPGPRLFRDERTPTEASASTAVDLAARHMTEALAQALGARGSELVAARDVEAAFLAEGQVVPRGDPGALAARVHGSFGASSVLLGELHRYRERSGGAAGSQVPAAVAMRVRLYSAPAGQLLWEGLFDEVQPSLSANPIRVSRYPGGGTRWLTAAQLSRFGAGELARSLAAGG